MARAFNDPGAVGQLAINLFNGWGYNFYRAENQLRADDLMIRARIGEILGAARDAVQRAEASYRREFLPPPSRERPRPDPARLAGAQALEAIGSELGALEGRVRALPVPETDRMTQRFRREAETLVRLAETDEAMVGHAEFLRSMLMGMSGSAMIESRAEIVEWLGAIKLLIQSRATLLAAA